MEKPVRNTRQKEELIRKFLQQIVNGQIEFESWILLFLRSYKRVISPCFALILFAKSYVIRIIFSEIFSFLR